MRSYNDDDACHRYSEKSPFFVVVLRRGSSHDSRDNVAFNRLLTRLNVAAPQVNNNR